MNKVSPKSLLHSKWTKLAVVNKEKHFVVTAVQFDENNKAGICQLQAVMNHNEYSLEWRELKNSAIWRQGWQ